MSGATYVCVPCCDDEDHHPACNGDHPMTDAYLPALPSGVYRHYKGPLYLVLGYAHDANADEFADYESVCIPETEIERAFPEGRAVVVYIGLQLDEAHTGPRLAVRTADDFHAWVHQDGTRCHHNTPGIWCEASGATVRQRFEYLGATWEGPST